MNEVWSYDFLFDQTADGRPLKILPIVDEFTRECLVMLAGRSLAARDVIKALAKAASQRGMPEHLRSDNGPEFIARAIRRFLAAAGVETLYIEPGSPWQNGYAESFHSRLRSELLDAEVFQNVAVAQTLAMNWRSDYNHHRPHSALDYRTPAEFAAGCVASASAAPALQQHNRLPAERSTLTQPVLS